MYLVFVVSGNFHLGNALLLLSLYSFPLLLEFLDVEAVLVAKTTANLSFPSMHMLSYNIHHIQWPFFT